MPDSLRDGLIINEILPQPIAGSGGYDTDGNGTAHANDEYIEFYNSSDAPIDISGIELWDPGWGRWFIFPEGSILPPDGYAILITNIQEGGSLPDADLSFAAGRSALINNSGGDHILLRDPLANEYIVASYDNPPPLDTNAIPGFPADQTQVGDGENFGAMIPGSSIQRVPNGGDSFENNLEPTPGAVNLCFVSGTLIMTPQGPRPIEVLRVGDEIMTAHGSRAPIRWLGQEGSRSSKPPQTPRYGRSPSSEDRWGKTCHRGSCSFLPIIGCWWTVPSPSGFSAHAKCLSPPRISWPCQGFRKRDPSAISGTFT